VVGSIFSYFLFMNTGPVLVQFANAFVNGLFGLIVKLIATVVFRLPPNGSPRAIATRA
jgi:hypothetical protein